MENKNQKENWLIDFRNWYKKEALPAVAWAVPLEKIEGKINELLKSERKKDRQRFEEILKKFEEEISIDGSLRYSTRSDIRNFLND